MNSLKIYNTLSREKEEFIPLNKNSKLILMSLQKLSQIFF